MFKKTLKFFSVVLFAIISVMFFILTVLCFSCPIYMANKFESVGMNKLAYGCFDKEYRSSTAIDEQYIMFNKAIELQLEVHTVYYGERIINNVNYKSLCLSRDSNNLKLINDYINNNALLNQNSKIRLKILNYNEDNYIKNQYVKALVNSKKEMKARNFIFEEINTIIKNKGYSEFTSFCVLPYIEKVKILNDSEIGKLENLYNQFTLNYEINIDDLKFKDLVVKQRLCEISQCISKAYQNRGNSLQADNWNSISNVHYEEIYGYTL